MYSCVYTSKYVYTSSLDIPNVYTYICVHVYASKCVYISKNVYTSKCVHTSSFHIPNVCTYIHVHMYTHPSMCTNLLQKNDIFSRYLKCVHTHIFLYVYTSRYVYDIFSRYLKCVHTCIFLYVYTSKYVYTYHPKKNDNISRYLKCVHTHIFLYMYTSRYVSYLPKKTIIFLDISNMYTRTYFCMCTHPNMCHIFQKKR